MAKHVKQTQYSKGSARTSPATTAPLSRVSSSAADRRSAYTLDPSPEGYSGIGGSSLPSASGYTGTPRNLGVVRKRKKKHRFLKFIATLLVLALVAVGAYAFLLNGRLALDTQTASDIRSQLFDRAAGDPYYVLVLGSDLRIAEEAKEGNEAYYGGRERADIIILIRVDEANKKITMLSIPRDTPVNINGAMNKINKTYQIGGAAATIAEVSRITGVEISHYVEVHIDGFVSMVDELGGVTIDVPTELTVQDALTGEMVTVYPGEQLLNGQQAQVVARARHEYEEQEGTRQQMVRQIVTAVLFKAMDRPLYQIPGTVLSMASHVDTDMNALAVAGLATSFSTGSSGMTVYSGTGPTWGDFAENGIWLCYENPAGWQAVMDVVEAGGDPATVDADAYL